MDTLLPYRRVAELSRDIELLDSMQVTYGDKLVTLRFDLPIASRNTVEALIQFCRAKAVAAKHKEISYWEKKL